MGVTMERVEEHLNAFLTIQKLTSSNISKYKIIHNTINSFVIGEKNYTFIEVAVNGDDITFSIHNRSYSTVDGDHMCVIAICEIEQILKKEEIKWEIDNNYIAIKLKNLEEFITIFNKCSEYLKVTVYKSFIR